MYITLVRAKYTGVDKITLNNITKVLWRAPRLGMALQSVLWVLTRLSVPLWSSQYLTLVYFVTVLRNGKSSQIKPGKSWYQRHFLHDRTVSFNFLTVFLQSRIDHNAEHEGNTRILPFQFATFTSRNIKLL